MVAHRSLGSSAGFRFFAIGQEYILALGKLGNLAQYVLALKGKAARTDRVNLDALGAGVVGRVQVGIVVVIVEVSLGIGDHEHGTDAVLVPVHLVHGVVERRFQVLGAVAAARRAHLDLRYVGITAVLVQHQAEAHQGLGLERGNVRMDYFYRGAQALDFLAHGSRGIHDEQHVQRHGRRHLALRGQLYVDRAPAVPLYGNKRLAAAYRHQEGCRVSRLRFGVEPENAV